MTVWPDGVLVALTVAVVVWIVIRTSRKRQRRATAELEREKIVELIRDLPFGAEPPFDVTAPNPPLDVYAGPLSVRDGGSVYHGHGRIEFRWLPSPRVHVELELDGKIGFDQLVDPEILIPGFRDAPVFLTEISPGFGQTPSQASGFVNGLLSPASAGHATGPHRFLLTNFHSYIGTRVRSPEPRLATSTRRWELTTPSASVIIDQVERCSELLKSTKAQGGFSVSHVGSFQQPDGTTMSESGAAELRSALRYFLAFARGFWVGPVLAHRTGSFGRSTEYGPYILTPWRTVQSWFPVHSPNRAGMSFAEFVRLFADPDWNEPLRYSVDWYVEANMAESLESAIVKSQVGLELFAWHVLVDQRAIKSGKKFGNDSAALNIRDLLDECGVPTSIPSHLADLASAATGWGAADGPGAFTQVRNAIIHSDSKKRAKLSSLGSVGKLQAKQLGLQYLELSLLATLGYSGPYADRTKRTGRVGEEATVPWAP